MGGSKCFREKKENKREKEKRKGMGSRNIVQNSDPCEHMPLEMPL